MRIKKVEYLNEEEKKESEDIHKNHPKYTQTSIWDI
jgi:hypothetical protein